LWDKVLPAALGGDNNVERSYFNDIITENGNYYSHWLTWKDGPGNHNLENSILFPDWPGSGYIVDTFISNYVFALAYEMQTYLHAPMAANWLPNIQRFYEGVCGEQATGHPVSYYCIDYNMIPEVHDGDHSIQGPSVGPYINGTDASDFGSFSTYTNILTGGQMQMVARVGYNLTNGDTIKNVNGAAQSPGLIDQLPGNQWMTIINVDNTTGKFNVVCPIAHPVTATCPTPGAAFTGFTRSGAPLSNEVNENIAYRFQYDPGPGAGFADNTYGPMGKMVLNGLQILGYDVHNAQRITDQRWGPSPWGYAPSWWWDPTVVVP
jgi:hypothetical protein